MSKEVTKELILALLVILATILVIGVILYDFVPNNKIIPEEVTYTTSKEVKDELKTTEGLSADEVLKTYTLDQTDLNNYQATNDYRPGKTNPFSTYQSQDGESDNSNSGNGSSGKSSGGNSSGNETSRNTPVAPGEVNPGNYTNDKGLK